MTQLFTDDQVVPVTLIEVGPCTVAQIKDVEQDGYVAVQVGFGTKKRATKPQRGHTKMLGNFAVLREFRPAEMPALKVGDVLTAETFAEGDTVKVSSITKGQGFQGVVKRHNFSGGPASHGQRHVLRTPGSTGSRFPQHTLKGTKMPGRSGGVRRTVRNLKIVKVDAAHNLIAVAGAVPGWRGGIIEVASQE